MKLYTYFSIILLIFLCLRDVNLAPTDEETNIIGGDDLKDGRMNIMTVISVKDNDIFRKCGGTIISRNAVLTSADCVVGVEKYRPIKRKVVLVQAGSFNPEDVDQTDHQTTGVVKVEYHDTYVRSNKAMGNIAVLFVDPPFNMTKNVGCAKLADLSPVRKFCTILGRDTYKEKKEEDGWLKYAQVEYNSSQNMDQLVFKRGISKGATGSPCEGDTGGPVLCGGKLSGVLQTIHQDPFSDYCPELTYFNATDISFYKAWLKSIQALEMSCSSNSSTTTPTTFTTTIPTIAAATP